MDYLITEGANKVAYIYSNPKDTTDAPVVMMCHGFSSNMNRSTYTDLEKSLNKIGIATIRFDFFGHGNSEGAFEDITISKAISNACDIYDFLQKKGHQHIGIFGSSFGGIVAMNTVKIKKEFFAIVLKAPVSDYYTKLNNQHGIDGIQKRQKNGKINYKEKLDIKYEFYEDCKKHTVYDFAKEIDIQTLIIHGDNDKIVPIDQSKKLDQILQNSTLHIVEGAGHRFESDERKLGNNNAFTYAFDVAKLNIKLMKEEQSIVEYTEFIHNKGREKIVKLTVQKFDIYMGLTKEFSFIIPYVFDKKINLENELGSDKGIHVHRIYAEINQIIQSIGESMSKGLIFPCYILFRPILERIINLNILFEDPSDFDNRLEKLLEYKKIEQYKFAIETGESQKIQELGLDQAFQNEAQYRKYPNNNKIHSWTYGVYPEPRANGLKLSYNGLLDYFGLFSDRHYGTLSMINHGSMISESLLDPQNALFPNTHEDQYKLTASHISLLIYEALKPLFKHIGQEDHPTIIWLQSKFANIYEDKKNSRK